MPVLSAPSHGKRPLHAWLYRMGAAMAWSGIPLLESAPGAKPVAAVPADAHDSQIDGSAAAWALGDVGGLVAVLVERCIHTPHVPPTQARMPVPRALAGRPWRS